jgi:hypothetical protein
MHAMILAGAGPGWVDPASGTAALGSVTQIARRGPFHEPTSLPCRGLD